MKRILIITTISGFVPQFEMNNVQILQDLGYQVHYASNFNNPHYGVDNHRLDHSNIIRHQIDFVRSPFCIGKNINAYRQLLELLERIPFDFVHCHTPMGGVLGRIAVRHIRRDCKKDGIDAKIRDRFKRIKVIYTAHGFHFFRGASFLNWIFYYPVERWLAHDTDIMITINEEDYEQAKKFHLRKSKNRKKQVWKVNGVGIDTESYKDILLDRKKKRKEFGISEDAYVFLSVGELSKRKNHQIVIKTLASMKAECKQKKIFYFICGEGIERNRILRLIQRKNLKHRVKLLGYRADIKEMLSVADCFIFPSKQEGLPVALMEALAAGLPCICSDVRGNIDLAEEGNIRWFSWKSKKQCKKAILEVISKKDCERQIERKLCCNSKYDKKQVCRVMRTIYQQIEEGYE